MNPRFWQARMSVLSIFIIPKGWQGGSELAFFSFIIVQRWRLVIEVAKGAANTEFHSLLEQGMSLGRENDGDDDDEDRMG